MMDDVIESLVGNQLSAQELVDLINAKICYSKARALPEDIDWKRTDEWRKAEMVTLRTPPQGYEYQFNRENHKVELVPTSVASSKRQRREDYSYSETQRRAMQNGLFR